MTPKETLVFKQYDTRQEAPSLRTTYHGAIADPTTPDDAPVAPDHRGPRAGPVRR